jgi:hypothetical protein
MLGCDNLQKISSTFLITLNIAVVVESTEYPMAVRCCQLSSITVMSFLEAVEFWLCWKLGQALSLKLTFWEGGCVY